MVAVPGEIAVTAPLKLTAAITGFDEIHGFTTAGVEALDKLVVEPSQTTNVPKITGVAITVTIVVIAQPLLFVNVIVALPAAFPVTTPFESIEATEELDEPHGFPIAGIDVFDKVVVEFSQTVSMPLIAAAALIVTICELLQPLAFVNVIVDVPKEIPVTTPTEFTVAIKGFEDIHGFTKAGASALDNCDVKLIQTLLVPIIVGSAFTVMVSISVHPFKPVKVIVVVPAEIPVTIPLSLTVAIKGSEDIHGFTIAAAEVVDKVEVAPTQTFSIPVIIGKGLMVMALVSMQPVIPVKVIVTVPLANPVTTPRTLTVASMGSEEIQGLSTAGVDVLDNPVF